MKEETGKASYLDMSVTASVEVTAASDNVISMDITPKISCGDTTVEIKDKYLNGTGMVLTLYAGKAVPDTITHHLESGNDETFYKTGTANLQSSDKIYRYETDMNGDVYVTLVVTEFSEFTISGAGIGTAGGGDIGGEQKDEISAKTENGKLTISNCRLASGYIIEAEYDNGKMMHIQKQNLSGAAEYVFNITDITLTVKYYILDLNYNPQSVR